MDERDHYEVLGVSRNATNDDIKRAYRRLAKAYHPDQNKGDAAAEAKFKELQAAYSVLSNSEDRARYDRFGGSGVDGAAAGGPHVAWTTSGQPIDLGDLSDLFDFSFTGGQEGRGGPSGFEQFFGGRGAGRPTAAGPEPSGDVEHDITLTFEQAVKGVSLELDVHGGRDGRRQRISVKVPAGVKDGQRIRLRGKGQPGRRGRPPGDVYIVCSIKPHRFFERRGHDIYLDVPITLDEAALGTKIDLPTLDGVRTVTVPAGTASGARLRLAGLGVRKTEGGARGDQYVVVKIVPPAALTAEQASLLRRFAATLGASPRDGLWA